MVLNDLFSPFFPLLIFLAIHNPSTHISTHPKFFTRPNDGWTGICIKLWHYSDQICYLYTCYVNDAKNGLEAFWFADRCPRYISTLSVYVTYVDTLSYLR